MDALALAIVGIWFILQTTYGALPAKLGFS
jgi:hypothetical protein